MNFLERDLENIIYNTPNSRLNARGLWITGRKFRQVNLGNYGVADIITIERDILFDIATYEVSIYELKKEKIDPGSFWQAMKYAKACKTIRELFRPSCRLDISIVLIGRHIDTSNSFCYANTVFKDIKLLTYDYQEDGIKFNDCSYHVSNHGLKLKRR